MSGCLLVLTPTFQLPRSISEDDCGEGDLDHPVHKDEHTVRVVIARDEGGEPAGDDCQESQHATGDEGSGSIEREVVSVNATLDDGDDEVMGNHHDCADSGH